MFFIDTRCYLCRTGLIGFRRCSDGKTLAMLCDECDNVWAYPDNVSAEAALDAAAPGSGVTSLQCSPYGELAGWATREEIIGRGWALYIAGEGPAAGERPSTP